MKTRWMMWGMAITFSVVMAVAQTPVPAPPAPPAAPAAPQAAPLPTPMAAPAPRLAPQPWPAIAPITVSVPFPRIDLDVLPQIDIDVAPVLAQLDMDWQDASPNAAAAAARAQERAQEAQERAQERALAAQDRARDRADRVRDDSYRDDDLYRRATELLDQAKWDKAVEQFDVLVQRRSARADGALYWKAWALYKEGMKDPSLTTLKALTTDYPNSRWLNDAKALQVEVNQSAGTPVSPDAVNDEEIRLLALQGIMHSDPDRALPILERLLKGSASPRLKERALFVLSMQSGNAPARDMLAQIAKGASNPDLQLKAITYLARANKEGRQSVAEIYGQTSDVTVKRRILQSYMENRDTEHLLAVAKSDQNADLRLEAVRYLSNLGARDEVLQLYAAESSPDVKRQIISSMYADGFSAKLADLARSEKDATLRRIAIRQLGHYRNSGELLVGLYDAEKDDQIKREILNSLFIQGGVKPLIDIARKEQNLELKKEAVGKLALMKSKEAQDFMMEILSK